MPIGFELAPRMATDALGVLWRDLADRAEANFFLSWHWIGCWLREAALQPDVLIGRDAGSVVLLGIVMPVARRNVLGLPVCGRHLNSTGEHEIDIITIEYNGFLVDRGHAGRVEAAAVGFLLGRSGAGHAGSGDARSGRATDELHLKSVSLAYAEALEREGVATRELARKLSYRIDLAAIRAAGTAYLPSLRANTRQKIRQSMRLYEAVGHLSLHRAATVDEALGFLDALGVLHQETWVARGAPGAFSYPFFVRFHRSLIAECLEAGLVEVVRVSSGAMPIGYVYNFLHRGQVLFYLSGFRYDTDRRLKPGLVTHAMCIEAHLNAGNAVYDFMEGEARYKASLGAGGPDSVYLLAQRPTLAIRLENRLRDLKRLLIRGRRTP